MVAPCAAILSCKQRHIPFSYSYAASHAPTQHDHDLARAYDQAHAHELAHANNQDHSHDQAHAFDQAHALDPAHAHDVDPHHYDPHMHDVHIEPQIEAQYHGYGVGVQSANIDTP